MKNLLRMGAIILVMAACQPPQEQGPARYTTDAPEITTAKAAMQAYLDGDWDALKATFADNAEVYHNSNTGVSPDENIASLREDLQLVSSYSLGDEQYWERIIDDNGEYWVYFWGTWNAVHAATEKDIEVPFHLAWQYEDGKVVEEYGAWDNTQMLLAEQEAAAAAEEM